MSGGPVDAIFRQAHRAPEKPALHYLGHRIGYGEFAYWIALARDFLAGQDLRAGSIAALVCVPDVFDGWVLRFALQSLGLTTVDLASPEELGAYRFTNIGCLITTIREQPVGVLGAAYKFVRIPDPIFSDKQAGPVPQMPTGSIPAGGQILLTSGTTGFRKKILRDAAGLSREMKRRCDLFSIDESSVVHALDFAPWTAAGYLLPIFSWSAGATVVCHRGPDLQRSFGTERITHALATPLKVEELLATPRGQLRSHPEMHLIVGGAPMTAALVRAAKAQLASNVSHYLTSTEGGPLALTRIDGPADLDSHVLFPDGDVQIVDATGRPLPPGHIGVIRVRPVEGVTGYFEDEEASHQFFRDGYFYPGDLGEIRADGRLVLHGRTTSTINLGGEKRPVEILEQGLQERLGLDAICLVTVRSPSREDELHILIQSQRPIGKDEVTKALASIGKLPSVPEAHVQLVDTIPRNEMGKLDRAAIRQQISNRTTGGLVEHDREREPESA